MFFVAPFSPCCWTDVQVGVRGGPEIGSSKKTVYFGQCGLFAAMQAAGSVGFGSGVARAAPKELHADVIKIKAPR